MLADKNAKKPISSGQAIYLHPPLPPQLSPIVPTLLLSQKLGLVTTMTFLPPMELRGSEDDRCPSGITARSPVMGTARINEQLPLLGTRTDGGP